MNLVGRIIIPDHIESFTNRGSHITIGNNKDKYFVFAYHAPNSSERKFGVYEIRYIMDNSYRQENWQQNSEITFLVDENIL